MWGETQYYNSLAVFQFRKQRWCYSPWKRKSVCGAYNNSFIKRIYLAFLPLRELKRYRILQILLNYNLYKCTRWGNKNTLLINNYLKIDLIKLKKTHNLLKHTATGDITLMHSIITVVVLVVVVTFYDVLHHISDFLWKFWA